MKETPPQYWFPAKRYGWGWGLPVRWQGWLVMLAYFGVMYLAIQYFRPRDNVSGFLVTLALDSAALIAIIAWKGEKPLKWRWGKG